MALQLPFTTVAIFCYAKDCLPCKFIQGVASLNSQRENKEATAQIVGSICIGECVHN